jgi:hypothetical protein
VLVDPRARPRRATDILILPTPRPTKTRVYRQEFRRAEGLCAPGEALVRVHAVGVRWGDTARGTEQCPINRGSVMTMDEKWA